MGVLSWSWWRRRVVKSSSMGVTKEPLRITTQEWVDAPKSTVS